MRRFLLGILMVGLISTGLQAQGDVRISAPAWSPNNIYLAIGTSDSVQVYNAEAEAPALLWQVGTEQPVQTVLFSPSGEWLAAGLGSGTGLDVGLVVVWMADSGEQVAAFEANQFMVSALAFSPDGQHLITGGGYFLTRAFGDYRVRAWNTTTWEELPDAEHSGSGNVTALAFSSDGQYMAFSNAHSSISLVSAETNRLLTSIHQESANCLLFNPEVSRMVTTFYRSVQVWELRPQPELHLVRQTIWRTEDSENIEELLPGEHVIGCSLDRFVASAEDGTLRIRDVETSEIMFSYHEEGSRFTTATLNSDGSRLAFVSDAATSPISQNFGRDYQVAIWNLDEAEPAYINLD